MKTVQVVGGILGTIGLVAIAGFAAFGAPIPTGHAPTPAAVVQVAVSPYVAPAEGPALDPRPTAAPIAPAAPAADPAPAVTAADLCPSGTQANSSDGYNDLSCAPDVCFNLSLPDPAHPECDYFYPPAYYR
jgi:hypothetical protein